MQDALAAFEQRSCLKRTPAIVHEATRRGHRSTPPPKKKRMGPLTLRTNRKDQKSMYKPVLVLRANPHIRDADASLTHGAGRARHKGWSGTSKSTAAQKWSARLPRLYLRPEGERQSNGLQSIFLKNNVSNFCALLTQPSFIRFDRWLWLFARAFDCLANRGFAALIESY